MPKIIVLEKAIQISYTLNGEAQTLNASSVGIARAKAATLREVGATDVKILKITTVELPLDATEAGEED